MESKGLTRVDARDKVTGHANYADDLFFPGMLYARTVHCPHARAQIVSVDAAEALGVPGVVQVYTAKDVGGINQKPQDKPRAKNKNLKKYDESD